MACGGCNTSMGLTKDQVENLINKFLDEGKLQGGLKTCNGDDLPKGSKVLTCAVLADAVNDLLKEGKVDVITDVKVEDGKLVVVDGTGKVNKLTTPFVSDLAFNSEENKLTWVQDGKDKSATLPYVKAVEGATGVVLTLPNGNTVELPKADTALTEDSFDDTIEKGANKADKFGVKLKDKGGLERTLDGIGIKLGDGVKLDESGAIQLGEVFARNPIKGKGTKADPLTVALNQRDFVVNPVSGEISLKAVQNDAVTNLNNGTGVMGMSTFYGVVNNTNGNTEYVTGVPANINSTDHQQNGTTAIGQLAAGQNYDFNGWQIATPAQVDQWLVGVAESVWHRTNDSGMNEDGSLKNSSDWGQWTRESNVNIPVQQFQKAVQDVLALEALTSNLNQRLTAIENDIVTLWDASGTVKLGRILKTK